VPPNDRTVVVRVETPAGLSDEHDLQPHINALLELLPRGTKVTATPEDPTEKGMSDVWRFEIEPPDNALIGSLRTKVAKSGLVFLGVV
jgi:hypothetical protein